MTEKPPPDRMGKSDMTGIGDRPTVSDPAVPGWLWRGSGCVVQLGLLAVVILAFMNVGRLGWLPWLALTVVSVAGMVGISVVSMLRGAPDTVCAICGYAFLVPGKPCPQCAPRVAMKIDWCQSCGYTLQGLPAGFVRCPECGVEVERAADA